LKVLKEPAFERGEFFGLNYANHDKPEFGHWLYAFLRRDVESGQAFLCVANFHPERDLDVKIHFTREALAFLGKTESAAWAWLGRLGTKGEIEISGGELIRNGLDVGVLGSCEAQYYELK
jgi:hypothetical protein